MVLLCGQHHRCLHEGGFSLARAHDGSLRFADGGGKTLSTNVFEVNTSESSSAETRPESTAAETARADPTYELAQEGSGPLVATDARPLDLHYAVSTVIGLWEWRRRTGRRCTDADDAGTADSGNAADPSRPADREPRAEDGRDVA